MDITLAIELVALFCLLGFSAFFSSSETSLFSLSPTQIQQMRRDRNPRLRLIEEMLSEPRRLIATILIGNELVNVSASVLSAVIVIDIFGADKSWLNIIIMVPLLLLFGEITPKTLALANNVEFATFQSRYIDIFARVISPLRNVVRAVSEFFINLIVSGEKSEGNILTEDMVRSLTRAAVGEGSLDAGELEYIHQIFDFGNKTVGDVMTYRSKIVAGNIAMSLDEIIKLQRRERHSKIPIFDETKNIVLGVLLARDLLGIDAKSVQGDDRATVEKLLREPYFIPESRMAADLFARMRDQHISIALVTDEFGGIIGIVTLEDLLECIFGDLPSGSDVVQINAPSLEILGNGVYRASGGLSIRQFNEVAGTELAQARVVTLAGLVLNACGEVPAKSDVVKVGNVTFTVVEVADQRILKLSVQVLNGNKGPSNSVKSDNTKPEDIEEIGAASADVIVDVPSESSTPPDGASTQTEPSEK